MIYGEEGNRMVNTMQQHYIVPKPHFGKWFHVFLTKSDDPAKKGYLGCYETEEEAKQFAIEAVGVEGNYTIYPSDSRDSARVKQEFRHKRFSGGEDYWETLKPMRNIRKGNTNHGY